MPEDTIEEITERLNRSLTMNQRQNGPSVSPNVPQGLTNTQIEQVREMINGFTRNPQDSLLDEGTDQPIGTMSNGLEELGKVPDMVKSLREFSGKPGEYSSWRKSVDRVLELFKSLRGTARYYAILHTIRTKIVGDADTALESYRTPLDWSRIRKCLNIHYSDKRDIGTLEYQMTVLCQGNRSITEFYQAVYQHLSLILDKVSCLELNDSSLLAMTNTYRDKALDTFIRGLNGDLPRLLSVREPGSLPQALHICLKLDNMNFRKDYAHGRTVKNEVRPLIPHTGGRPKFFPELAHIGGIPNNRPIIPRFNPGPTFNPSVQQRFNNPNPQAYLQGNMGNFNGNFQWPQYQAPQQNFQRSPYQTPQQNFQKQSPQEPMEIDRSLQTKPQFNSGYKRPAENSVQTPRNKMQRNFHLGQYYTPEQYYAPDQYYDQPLEGNEAYGACGGVTDDIEDYLQHCPDEFKENETQDGNPSDISLAVNFLD